MSEIKCAVVRDLMPLVADDVASEESKELVNGHVEGCEVCRAYYEGMTAQLARMAMPEDGPTSTFVDFSHKMEKRVRMKKVLIALAASILALCVVVVGIAWVNAKMNDWEYMPTEHAQAWLYQETDGDVCLLVKMEDGYGWYDWMGVNKRDSVLWLTPYEPDLKLWNRGNPGFSEQTQMFGDELYFEDGVLYYSVLEWHTEYDAELESFREISRPKKIPLDLVRWGHENDFTTLYEKGDEIPTYTELMREIEGSAPLAESTPAPTATVVPEKTSAASDGKKDLG